MADKKDTTPKPVPVKEPKPVKELTPIRQDQLLTTCRELRDRTEISLHKLGQGGKSIQQHLNAIVATLSAQNAHPVDDKQADMFGGKRAVQPRAAGSPKPAVKKEPKVKYKVPDPFGWNSDEKLKPSPQMAELIGVTEPITWKDAKEKIDYLTTENPMLEEVKDAKGKSRNWANTEWRCDEKLKKFFGRDTFMRRDIDKNAMKKHFTRIPEEQEAARVRAEAKAKRDAATKAKRGW